MNTIQSLSVSESRRFSVRMKWSYPWRKIQAGSCLEKEACCLYAFCITIQKARAQNVLQESICFYSLNLRLPETDLRSRFGTLWYQSPTFRLYCQRANRRLNKHVGEDMYRAQPNAQWIAGLYHRWQRTRLQAWIESWSLPARILLSWFIYHFCGLSPMPRVYWTWVSVLLPSLRAKAELGFIRTCHASSPEMIALIVLTLAYPLLWMLAS